MSASNPSVDGLAISGTAYSLPLLIVRVYRCAWCLEPVDGEGRCPRGCGHTDFRAPSCCVCLGPVTAAGACARRCCYITEERDQ